MVVRPAFHSLYQAISLALPKLYTYSPSMLRVCLEYGVLPHGVDEDDGKDHEDSEDHESDLEPLLEFAAEDDGVETALLEQRGAVLAMMMMM